MNVVRVRGSGIERIEIAAGLFWGTGKRQVYFGAGVNSGEKILGAKKNEGNFFRPKRNVLVSNIAQRCYNP